MTVVFERRPERAEDEPFLAALHRDTHPLPGLDPALAEALQRQQFAARRAGYRAAHPRARFDIVEADGERIGRIVVDEGAEGWRVVDVALSAPWRGRGLGTGLISDVMARAREAGSSVALHVMLANTSAVRLYERLGFRVATSDEVHAEMVWRPS